MTDLINNERRGRLGKTVEEWPLIHRRERHLSNNHAPEFGKLLQRCIKASSPMMVDAQEGA